ncbi:CoA transferase [Candidatus Amarobacter glycogenicus]|uniref:CaiB/BaiF CoA transferase family protein n=1 Tax=Candidatus Amarobacter glycogenicus TaxID=3140699 RepID=UPI003136099D|nr:CoA transferase [Dehalococcoidia bacterium]
MQALDNVRVLDLTQHIAGPYATRLFADFGADVIKVEKPGGDVTRRMGPFKAGQAHPEKSGLYFYLNCNKRSVVLDLRTEEGKLALAALAKTADIVVESYAPATKERLGIGYEWFKALKPSLPVVSISNFGQDGPYRDFKLTDLTLYAFAGEMYSMGETDREPVKMAGTAALFESGAASAVGIMGALFASKRHGIGQHVDISLAETHFGGVDRRHATAIAFQFSGRKTLRVASHGGGMPGGIYPCADGYVDFTNAGLRPDRVADMLNHADWLNDPRYSDPMQRMDPAVIEEWNGNFIGWCIERTKREVWQEARRAKVMCGPMFTMEDLFTDESFRNRGFWTRTSHPEMGELTIPGRPLIMEKNGWELRRAAPLLGQHTKALLAESGLDSTAITAASGGAA